MVFALIVARLRQRDLGPFLLDLALQLFDLDTSALERRQGFFQRCIAKLLLQAERREFLARLELAALAAKPVDHLERRDINAFTNSSRR